MEEKEQLEKHWGLDDGFDELGGTPRRAVIDSTSYTLLFYNHCVYHSREFPRGEGPIRFCCGRVPEELQKRLGAENIISHHAAFRRPIGLSIVLLRQSRE